MESLISKDGTILAFERFGDGQPAIVVGAALQDRATYSPLAKRFTVFNYDRRGKCDSGDTVPYAVEREIEDLRALIAPLIRDACADSTFGYAATFEADIETAITDRNISGAWTAASLARHTQTVIQSTFVLAKAGMIQGSHAKASTISTYISAYSSATTTKKESRYDTDN
ncbi:hypothetical protein BH23ACT11_BH23ACT11_07070 [soil metagenome]